MLDSVAGGGARVVYKQTFEVYEREMRDFPEVSEDENWYNWAEAAWDKFIHDKADFLNAEFVGIRYDDDSVGHFEWTSVMKAMQDEGVLGDEVVIKFLDNGALCVAWNGSDYGSGGVFYLIGVDEDGMYDEITKNKWGEKVYGEEVVTEDDIREAIAAGDTSSPEISRCLYSIERYL